MSVKATSWVFEQSGMIGSPLLVFLCFADRADKQGVAWPKYDDLAERARVSEKTVERAIKKILASGELEVLHKPSPLRRATTYQMTWIASTPQSRCLKGAAKKTPASSLTPDAYVQSEVDSGVQSKESPTSGLYKGTDSEPSKEPLKGKGDLPGGDSEKRRRPKVKSPSLEEWLAYAAENGYPSDEAEDQFDYWESVGWKRGKMGKPVENWKNVMNTSIRQYKRNGGQMETQKDPSDNPPENWQEIFKIIWPHRPLITQWQVCTDIDKERIWKYAKTGTSR